jgi:hypothetical protein
LLSRQRPPDLLGKTSWDWPNAGPRFFSCAVRWPTEDNAACFIIRDHALGTDSAAASTAVSAGACAGCDRFDAAAAGV